MNIKKSGKKIIIGITVIALLAAFVILPSAYPYRTISISYKKDGVEYVLQRSNRTGNYYLSVDEIINSNYPVGSTYPGIFNTNNVKIEMRGYDVSSGKIVTSEKIDTKTDSARLINTTKGNALKMEETEFYFFQNRDKLIVTPDIDYINSEYLFDRPKVLSSLYNFLTPDNKIDLEFGCSSEYCKNIVDEFNEQVEFYQKNSKVRLKYTNSFVFNSNLEQKPNLVQNLRVVPGFVLMIDDQTFDFSDKENVDLDTYLVEIYESEDRSETELLKDTIFFEYINNTNKTPDNNQIILQEKCYDQKSYHRASEIDEIKLVHKYNNYKINVLFDNENLSEIEVDPFYEIITFRYDYCVDKKCSRSFELEFDDINR